MLPRLIECIRQVLRDDRDRLEAAEKKAEEDKKEDKET